MKGKINYIWKLVFFKILNLHYETLRFHLIIHLLLRDIFTD